MQTNKENVIVDLSFTFALKIIKYAEALEKNRRYIIARQLLNSGTSIGANVREAQNAESKNDFVHTFKIAAKEADETQYWLLLCKNSGYDSCDELLENGTTILKSILKIIASSESKESLNSPTN